MAIKHDIPSLLIYITMCAWLVAGAFYLLRKAKVGEILFAGGCAVLVAAFVVRWIEVEHAPLQNLYEVFLCLGAVIYPLWLFSRKFLDAQGPAINVLLGWILLFPAGFVFHAEPQRLPPALQSWLFIPHVSAYMLAYVVLAMAAGQAILRLTRGAPKNGPDRLEASTYRLVCLGFPLLTVGLMLGALWGKLAWGDYWNWDPKELWSLITFLVYLVYLHFRSLYGARHPRASSVLAIAGCLAVILTLLWVNLSRLFPGMHSYAT
jgi:ABC-type transport system involved in cytochrome c biogenesis permease subunit